MAMTVPGNTPGMIPMSREQVEQIWRSDKLVIQLAADWLKNVQAGNYGQAAAIRRNMNRIKREIREKYEIIL